MSEPLRLRELSEDGFERSLLDAGVAYQSSDAARAKTLAALGLAGSAAVSIGAASLASSSIASKLGWAKLFAISSLGAAVVAPAGYYAWQHARPAEAPVAVVASPAPKTPKPVVAPQTSPRELPAAEAVVEPAVETPAAETPSAPAAPRVDSRAVSQSALAAELAALDAARSKLGSGDAEGALALLADYSRTYPRGRLALEAEVLRIDALAKSGQSALATRRAEAFLRRHPNSVLASRVRGYLPE
ncbi:MAG TPA: hypothetical protein VGK73_26605 [Polyangiaceae bacterium]